MKIAIIGAGPIGLYFATLCEKNNINYTIFESDSFIGGQLTHLYPEKVIYNIPGIESIKAVNYIDQLLLKIDSNKIVLKYQVNTLEPFKQYYDYIIIDCPPSLNLITINALVSSDSVYTKT